MRIVSLNCWGGRVPGLIDWLKASAADVYCLQEMYSTPLSNVEEVLDPADVHDSSRKGRINLFSEIQAALPEHHGFFWPFARNFIHDGVASRVEMFYGLGTFVRKTLPIMESRTEFVFGEFRSLEPTGEKNRLPLSRNAHAFRILDPTSKDTYTIAHMHGLWVPEGKEDNFDRRGQAAWFAEVIDEVRDSGDLIIACGDWNVLPTNSMFTMLKQMFELEDLVTRTGDQGTRTSYYFNGRGKGKPPFADYMLVSPRGQVKRFEIVRDPEVSDHCPLVLDIE